MTVWKKSKCIARRLYTCGMEDWMPTRKYLRACIWKKRFLTMSSFFSHFSGSTTIHLWIRDGVPRWPTSTLYSNSTDFDTVSPTPSLPWIFREIITWLHLDINSLLKQPALLEQILSAQGQIGWGLHQRIWPGVGITWDGCRGQDEVHSRPSSFMIKQQVTKETVPVS